MLGRATSAMVQQYVAICFVAVILAAGGASTLVVGVENGLGAVPPMGYNTWNDFRCDNITARNVMRVADAIVDTGLGAVGYSYINIDDCWAVSRNPHTFELVPDPIAFPDGMKAVADYVHGKGLRFGIYTDRGPLTCANRTGSAGFEGVDAETFASWGVDFLKEDSCYADSDHHDVAIADYMRMRDALNATGRPIFFSLCGWHTWYAPVGRSLGNSWRISGDVSDWSSVYAAAQLNSELSPFAGPGGWNDPDMLVGSSAGGAIHNTPEQSRTQFSLWSIMASPLLIGSNLLGMSKYDLETYSNTEVIAVNQDALGVQGKPIASNCSPSVRLPGSGGDNRVPECQQVWAKLLSDGSAALIFVNWAGPPTTVECDSVCLSTALGSSQDSVYVRDLWKHRDLGVLSKIRMRVGADGASVTLKITPAPTHCHPSHCMHSGVKPS